MIKIRTLFFVAITAILIYSFWNNDIVLFFLSLILFPLIIMIQWCHTNGLPKFRIKNNNKFSLQVKTVKKTKSDVVNEVLLGVSLFRRFNDYFKNVYSKDIEPSGVSKSISDVSMNNLKIVLVSVIFSVVLAIVLFSVTNSLVSFLLLFLPLIVFTINRYELRSPTIQRKNGVEKELLFFSIFCDIMDNTQLSIYRTFEIIIHDDDSGLFPWIRKEGIIIQRDVVAFGDSSLHALRNLSDIHPSKLFSEFIAGYLTSQSAGGRDTGDYLAERTREYQVISKQKMNYYTETSDGITQMVSFGLIMYPIMIVLSSTMTTGENILFMIIFGFFFIPATIFVLIKKIESISPFSNDHIPLFKVPIILSAVTLLACIIIQLEYWEMLLFPLMVWSITNYAMIRNRLVTNYNIDKSIPRFVRDMNQSMLSGSSFFRSFNIIAEQKSYTNEFNSILNKIKKDILFGQQLNDSMLKIYTTSHLSKLIIKIISYTAKSGEVTPLIMEKLAIFSNNYIESKSEVASKTTISVILSYMGSLIVIVLVLIIPSVNMGNYTEIIDEINDVSLDDTLTSMNIMLVIITSFISMILVSKIRYGTIQHSLNNGVVLIVISIILYYNKIIGLNIS